ncbi:MAG: hypothetical protein NC820_03460 [Candidatus Omnitrophica bacterium]|nr:hypothetical protein [Candidatus Omnitrophota bacterium]
MCDLPIFTPTGFLTPGGCKKRKKGDKGRANGSYKNESINFNTNPKKSTHISYKEVVSKLILLVVSSAFRYRSIVEEDNCLIDKVPVKNVFDKYLRMYREAREYIFREGVDIISTDEPFSCFIIGIILKRKYKIPLNVWIYATIFENNLGCSFIERIKFFVIRFLLRESSSIRAMCDKHREMLAKKFLLI